MKYYQMWFMTNNFGIGYRIGNEVFFAINSRAIYCYVTPNSDDAVIIFLN